MEQYMTYPKPTGKIWDNIAKLFKELQKDERYLKAKSCKHCHDPADSFNRYVSTYCSKKQEHIAGFEDRLDGCCNCQFYARRGTDGRRETLPQRI